MEGTRRQLTATMNRAFVADLRIQLVQQNEDAKRKLFAAQSQNDMRRIDFFTGQLHAFRIILDTIEVNELEPENLRKRA